MAKAEPIRMQNLRHNFSRLDQPRPRTVKEMMAIDEINSSLLHRAQIRPRWILREQVQVTDGLRNFESAREQKHDLWISLNQARPIEPRRMFPRLREEARAACDLDEFRHPIPACH